MSGITITTENFDTEVLRSPLPVLIDFWAPWCGPCKMIGPVIDNIADEYSGKLKVGKVNIDEQAALAERYGISSIPTLLLYKDGEMVTRKSGAGQKRDIEALFNSFI